MGVLEQVSQMKSQGIPEQEIVSRLQQQRVSPKDINDALNQSKIKEAVYDPHAPPAGPMPMPENVEAPYAPNTQDVAQENYAPQQEYTAPPQQEYAAPQEMYQQEGYATPPMETGQSSDMIIEISEQVFSEKIKKIERQIDKLNEIQTILQTQTEHATDKLKRIESVMDKLQIAILERVGSYGKNLETIKKEMTMIEDSFSKIVPGHHKIIHKTTPSKTQKKKAKKK